ncbi:hypothetical protein EV1_043338 [Malus domestica]
MISAKLTLHVTDVDTSGKADGWNQCFDKLPVISAKLTLHVTDANTSGKADASRYLELPLRSLKSRRVQRWHVTSADKSGKEDRPWFLSKPNF